jgi:hypothetical protein
VLVTFLDTDCKTKCPVFASDIGAGLRLLSGSERREVNALALTVNPARDTPARVRAFLRRRHALGIDFLLGTAKQMRPIWKAFHVVSAAETGNADVHSSDARVYDRSGVWVSTLHLPVDLTPANLAHDLRTALAQPVSAQSAVTIEALKQRFDLLSRQHSNKCSLRPESLDSIAVHRRLQGSCCSAVDFQRYVRQLHGLRAYARVSEIPTDPYDVPVSLARGLTSYAESITPTPLQQTTYDGAVKLSHEHGPCCCHCWRWTAFEGEAKYLIARRDYSGGRIAAIRWQRLADDAREHRRRARAGALVRLRHVLGDSLGADPRVRALGRRADARLEGGNAAPASGRLAALAQSRLRPRRRLLLLLLRRRRASAIALPQGRRLHRRDGVRVRLD